MKKPGSGSFHLVPSVRTFSKVSNIFLESRLCCVEGTWSGGLEVTRVLDPVRPGSQVDQYGQVLQVGQPQNYSTQFLDTVLQFEKSVLNLKICICEMFQCLTCKLQPIVR